MILKSITLASIATLMAAPVTADQFRAALLSGSEAVITHFLAQPGLPPAAGKALDQFNTLHGYKASQGAGGTSYFIMNPLATLDPNVTGGVPNDSISVAGMNFTIDPDFVAQSDVLLGLGVRAGARRNLAPGLSLDAKIAGSIGYAPRVKVTKASITAQSCLRAQINVSRYAHGCVGADFRSVDTGDQVGAHIEGGMTQAFSFGRTVHAITADIGVRKSRPEGGASWEQSYLRLSSASALRNGTALTASVEISEAVSGVQAGRLRLSAGMIRDIKGRPASITAFYTISDGGMFLGLPREDETSGISISYQVTKAVTLTGSLSKTSSNASLFESGVDFAGGVQIRF